MLAALTLTAITLGTPTSAFAQPQLAQGQGITALTFASPSTIYFTHSPDRGKTFAPPTTVTNTKIMLGRHRGPRIAITPTAIVIAAIHNGNLLAWRSTNRGQTWTPTPARINDAPNAAREGLHALTALPNGHLAAAWLDLRTGKMKLYTATSTDHGLTWQPNTPAYPGSPCECCHPTLAAAPDGALHLMFRNSLDGNRDLYLATSRNQGRTFTPPEKLGDGSWPLNACPMDGGAIALDESGVLTTIWRRESTIYIASPGRSERSIGQGKDPAISAAGRNVWAAWTHAGTLNTWSATSLQATPHGPGAYPVLLGSLLAYEDAGRIHVKDLAAK